MRAARLFDQRSEDLQVERYAESVCRHLLAVSPTCHWLEYVDWASPILQEPFEVKDGYATAPDRPGIGIAWDEARVARCLAG